jgi:hypothetical protein
LQFHNFKKNVAPQQQLRISAFAKSTTLTLQLESFTSAIVGIFLAVESGRFMKRKSEVKTLVLLSLKGKFLFSRETHSSKNIFG